MATQNEPGNRELHYRVDTHGGFRASMLAALSRPGVLRDLTVRTPEDPTIALIDAWATVLDVLTFYQERNANEGYLRTATERFSLVELARHLNYQPGPGVAADTYLAFRTDQLPGSPLTVAIGAGTQVQSIPGKGQAPQRFETVADFTVNGKHYAIPARRATVQRIRRGTTRIVLQGTSTGLAAGDTLLILGRERREDPGSERWDIRTVTAVRADSARETTTVHWREGLGHYNADIGVSPDDYEVYALRERAALFGHNAPDFRMMAEEVKETFDPPGGNATEWPGHGTITSGARTLHLDRDYPQLLVDSWVALSGPYYTELYRLTRVVTDGREQFGLTGKSTRITLDTDENLSRFDRRTTVVLARSERLPVAPAEIEEAVYGSRIRLEGAYPDLEPGQALSVSGEVADRVRVTPRETIVRTGATERTELRPLVLERGGTRSPLTTSDILDVDAIAEIGGRAQWSVRLGGRSGLVRPGPGDLVPLRDGTGVASAAEVAVIKEVLADGEGTTLLLERPLERVYFRETFRVNANVAYATHGEAREDILGSGDGSAVFQRFDLKDRPLTYVSAASSSGRQTTLEVRVEGLLWREVSSFYGRGPDERIYITRQEDGGGTYVRFGDGITGARLPTGVENVRATYRVGTGFAGMVGAGQLSLLLTPQPGLLGVTNPVAATGGDDPEPPESIRENAPLTVLTMDRLVSLTDYGDFARSFAGIGKAAARLMWRGEDRIVHLTVAAAGGGPVTERLKTTLAAAIDGYRHANLPVIVDSYRERFFGLTGGLRIAEDHLPESVLAEAHARLSATFSFASRHFGQDVTPSEVIAVIQAVPGVVYFDLDTLDGRSIFSRPHFRLSSAETHWRAGSIRPAELLLLDPARVGLTLR